MAATAEGNSLTQEQRDRMCSGKQRFAKEGQAIDKVIARQRAGVRNAGRVYKCPVCRGYHIAQFTRKAA